MALIWDDTADYYSLLSQLNINWGATTGASALTSAQGPFGGPGILANTSDTSMVSKTFNYAISNTIPLNLGFWIKTSSSGTPSTSNSLLQLVHNLGTWQVLTATSSATSLSINKQFNGSGTQTGTANVCNGVYHFIQISVLFSTTSSGFVKVYVDGVLDISYSGITVIGTFPTTFQTFKFSPGILINSTSYTSGFYIWDSSGSAFNTFPLPSLRTVVLSPNANGSTVQYTPSTGSNFSCVNGGFAGANFVSNASTGQLDLYAYPTLSYTPQTVYAVVGNYYGQNSGGTGTANLIPTIKTGASTATNATQTLALSVSNNYKSNFYTDASSNPWTASTVNAIQLGQGD